MTSPPAEVGGNVDFCVDNLTVVYDDGDRQTTAVDRLSFCVVKGEFLCLLGTSGCGKSTILRVLAGFVRPTRGAANFQGLSINSPGPERGFVFQQHSLFPWKTVRANVEFGLRMRGVEGPRRKEVSAEFIRLVGLNGFERAYPGDLSGGMQQRVGLARTLANDPAAIMMDEPFGSLDAQTRGVMQELLLRVWAASRKTVVFVTHDVDEAILLADRILVLTARPACVKAEVSVGLPRPRDQSTTTSVDFLTIKRQVLGLIREETMKSIASTPHTAAPTDCA